MIRTLIKKDFLHFIRDRKELFILLVLPLLLISIIGFSLKDALEAMSGNRNDFTVTLAVVDEGDHQAEANQFLTKVEKVDEKTSRALTSLSLPNMLTSQIQENEQLSMLELTQVDDLDLIDTDDYDGVIHFPSGYRLEAWEQLVSSEQKVSAAKVYLNEQSPLKASLVNQVIDQLYRYWNIQVSLDALAQGEEVGNWFTPAQVGEWTSIDEKKPVSTFAYYTIGMSVMFVLYIASFVAIYAQLERQNHVFHRMMLANISPWAYMISKWLSGTGLAFLQLIIIFGSSTIFYQTTLPSLLPFLAVTLMLAVTVGSLTALLTALTYHFQTRMFTNVFSGAVVSIFSLIGGSFFDTEQMSDTLQDLGQWTPNGLAMRSYLHLFSGGELSALTIPFYRLSIISVLLFVGAWLFFPRKGDAR